MLIYSKFRSSDIDRGHGKPGNGPSVFDAIQSERSFEITRLGDVPISCALYNLKSSLKRSLLTYLLWLRVSRYQVTLAYHLIIYKSTL